MNQTAVSIFLVAIGVTLLLNPLYVHPEGASPSYHYEMSEVTEENLYDALRSSPDALVCGGYRSCALEEQLIREGPMKVDKNRSYRQNRYWVVVYDGYYQPVEEENETATRLSVEEISEDAALRLASRNVENVHPDTRRAVEDGELWIDESVPEIEDGVIVQTGEGYYYPSLTRRSSEGFTRPIVLLQRVLLSVLGLLSVFGGAYWQRRGSE